MTFASAEAISDMAVELVATTAIGDGFDVEYQFYNYFKGYYSGWQRSQVWIDQGVATVATGDVTIANADFEATPDAGAGYTFDSNSGDGVTSSANTADDSGNGVAYAYVNGTETSATGGYAVVVQSIDLTPELIGGGDDITLSADIKALAGKNGGGAFLKLEAWADGVTLNEDYSETITVTESWDTYSIDYTTPSGADEIRVVLGVVVASTTASDSHYYFDDLAISGTYNIYAGLSAGVQCLYLVWARDTSPDQNTTSPGSVVVYTAATDTAAPTPSPMSFVSTDVSVTMIKLVATTATDDKSRIEYYFDCTAGPGNDSGWQTSPVYYDLDVTPGTNYSYTVIARDISRAQNSTTVSAATNITTLAPMTSNQMFYRVVSTQSTHIVSFESNGMLVWSNSVPDARCRIESLPSLVGSPPSSSLSAEIICEEMLMSVKMPMQPVETPIVLSIYSDGWGTLLETRALSEAQIVTIQFQEEFPDWISAQYYVYAHQDDHYTKVYSVYSNQAFYVELEPVDTAPFSMTGVIFSKQLYFKDCYFNNEVIGVTGPSGSLPDIITDPFGRYSITNNTIGTYTLDFSYQDVPFSFNITNSSAVDYKDLSFNEPTQWDAPNIYLYPETETNVTVTLGYPNGGQLIASDPPYNSGWNVSVDTDGIIDEHYGYLFYEAKVPQALESKEGWLLDGSNLEGEFRELMAELGCQGREIDDFMEYWMPLMKGSSWYAVYPQNPEMVTTLNITPAPQNVLRCLFVVRALTQPISIPQPTIVPFVRSGFTVVEWGVSGWEH